MAALYAQRILPPSLETPANVLPDIRDRFGRYAGSPVFVFLGDLEDWLVDQGYSRKAAEKFAECGYAPSMLMVNDRGGVRFAMDIHSLDIDA